MYIIIKRFFDFLFSLILIIGLFPFLLFLFLIVSYDTRSYGFYKQNRIGFQNRPFFIYKFKTMYDIQNNLDFITSSNDPRITTIGKYLRKYKIDELPQLFNVLIGDMSFVGPRPDVIGYAENLSLENQYLLKVRPGISSFASLYFKNEEIILSMKIDKLRFNNEIIWPLKVKLNNDYAKNISFLSDMYIILKTIGLLKYPIYPDQKYL